MNALGELIVYALAVFLATFAVFNPTRWDLIALIYSTGSILAFVALAMLLAFLGFVISRINTCRDSMSGFKAVSRVFLIALVILIGIGVDSGIVSSFGFWLIVWLAMIAFSIMGAIALSFSPNLQGKNGAL